MSYIKTKLIYLKKQYLREIVYLVLGCSLMAVGTSFFLLPNQLSTGGFTGIATIFYYLFNFPLGTVIFILNIPFFIWAFLKVGRRLIIKSIIGTALLSTFIDVFEKLPALTEDRFLACIYGGVFIGIGLAFLLKAKS